MHDFLQLYNSPGFDFFLSMDCEGPIFDKNLYNNVSYLEKLLKLTTKNDIYTILFITPKFAEMLNKQGLIEEIKNNYKVIFGLHIHPNDLPDEINKICPFVKKDIDLISDYSLKEQSLIIKYSAEYINNLGIEPLQGFRGGYFSISTDTESALMQHTNIKWESHNMYRHQYNVKNHLLLPVPVYAFNEEYEMRIENFETSKLTEMLIDAIVKEKKVIATTHSYLLDINDFHYKRDKINQSLYYRLTRLINVIQLYKENIEPLESIV